MTRTIWSAALAMFVAGAVAIPVIAQPPQGGRGQGRGPAFDGARPVLRGLNLTDAQREQIRSITEGQRTGDNPRRNVMDLERQLQAALFAEAPDQAKIDQLKNSITAARAAELTSRIELQSRIAQVLTPEQRAQARETLDKAPAGRGPRTRFP